MSAEQTGKTNSIHPMCCRPEFCLKGIPRLCSKQLVQLKRMADYDWVKYSMISIGQPMSPISRLCERVPISSTFRSETLGFSMQNHEVALPHVTIIDEGISKIFR